MPKRTDLHKILLIGSGPIVIGQACEFDYSGTQACKALAEEGCQIVLVNSNPATIMTDPEMAAHTYIEPITAEVIEKIIAIEKPDALLPTMGGQTALNVTVELAAGGVLEKYGVELIGASLEAIRKAEDRRLFRNAMDKIGLKVPHSGFCKNQEEANQLAEEIGFPLIIRPSFTMGGSGGSIAYNREEFEKAVVWGMESSPIQEVLIEQSILGWKEYELEVMRDQNDNVVVICSIENFDPMGVHTGDSITVAPAQTLSDKEYQVMRNAALAIMREIGVDTGGSNVQFAVNPDNGDLVVIEMNPRVSRSSALASKATGFPIAKIAAKLALGYTLDEIPNDITKETPASFEPMIDYVVTKIPRFAFEKFPGGDTTLGPQMKSVGEAMSIGRTFKESLQKGLRSLETGRFGLGNDGKEEKCANLEELIEKLRLPNADRIFYLQEALERGMSIDEIFEYTKIDRWFLHNIKEILDLGLKLEKLTIDTLPTALLRQAKEYGFSDKQLSYLLKVSEKELREHREGSDIRPVFKTVDTCAAEFEAHTPYYYSSYESEDEVRTSDKEKVMILGSGPNRIGQGIEFDYTCVHGSYALRELGYETIMVNSNPETVSTDYDTSDRLYFEPLTAEDVMAIIKKENPLGVIVQFGGQTPLKLALPLYNAGVPILGTSPDSIDIAENRERFKEIIDKLGLVQPDSDVSYSFEGAIKIAHRIGYPVLVRPSYVLGGRAMEIIYDDEKLATYMRSAIQVNPEHPVLIDKFVEDATEIDVDALCDGEDVFIGGIMEHIEQAGIHSGDSACALPPISIEEEVIVQIKEMTRQLALELKVVGPLNIQFAVSRGTIYVLEVNPRASRTLPFVSKATGVPLAKVAARLMVGKKLKDMNLSELEPGNYVAVKEAVLPFVKFPGTDIILGPEMRSTGEVMGIDTDFGWAFAKSQAAAGQPLPTKGSLFVSVNDHDKPLVADVVKHFVELGFTIVATTGKARYLNEHGLEAETVFKVKEGRPTVVDLLKDGKIDIIVNTPLGRASKFDELSIRREAIKRQIPIITTIAAAKAAATGIAAMRRGELQVKSIQEYHALAGRTSEDS